MRRAVAKGIAVAATIGISNSTDGRRSLAFGVDASDPTLSNRLEVSVVRTTV